MGRTVFVLAKSDSQDGPLYTQIFDTLDEACQALEDEYTNLCPTDGDLDIDYDKETGELSWIDADMGCKVWVCVHQAWLEINE